MSTLGINLIFICLLDVIALNYKNEVWERHDPPSPYSSFHINSIFTHHISTRSSNESCIVAQDSANKWVIPTYYVVVVAVAMLGVKGPMLFVVEHGHINVTLRIIEYVTSNFLGSHEQVQGLNWQAYFKILLYSLEEAMSSLSSIHRYDKGTKPTKVCDCSMDNFNPHNFDETKIRRICFSIVNCVILTSLSFIIKIEMQKLNKRSKRRIYFSWSIHMPSKCANYWIYRCKHILNKERETMPTTGYGMNEEHFT